jgi:hypothetical protein
LEELWPDTSAPYEADVRLGIFNLRKLWPETSAPYEADVM